MNNEAPNNDKYRETAFTPCALFSRGSSILQTLVMRGPSTVLYKDPQSGKRYYSGFLGTVTTMATKRLVYVGKVKVLA